MADQDNTSPAPTTPVVVAVPPTPTPSTLGSLVEDNTGGLSAMRVLMLIWGIGVFAVWAFATVMAAIHGVYTGIGIPESVVTILMGVVLGKVVQRPLER